MQVNRNYIEENMIEELFIYKKNKEKIISLFFD